jgi:hypothetical protein
MIKMNKVLTTAVIGATLAIGFSGCGGMNNPLPPKQMSSTKIDSINVEYKFNDDINDISLSKSKMIQAITSHMSSNSKYVNKKIRYNGNVNPTFGKTINYNNDMLVIDYVNGDQNCGKKCENGESLTKVFFRLPTKITENSKNNFTVTSNFPTNYTIRPHTDAIGMEHETLDTPSKLEADAKNMFNSLKSIPLTIKRSVEFKGEVNTKYPDKAVYANFKRILGSYSWRRNETVSEVKKQNSFNLKSNPLHVEVYPYRDGSKVTYSTTLKYTIDSNGNSTLTKKDIDALHNKIAKIIND